MRAISGFGRIVLVPGLLCASLWPAPAAGWTEDTRARIVRQSMDLMPDSLKGILKQQEVNCLQGARAAAGAAGNESRHRGHDTDALRERIESTAVAVRETVDAINRHEPFRQIAFRFGEVAHLVADLNYPLNHPEGGRVPDPAYDRYGEFVETAMERFTVTLDPTSTASLQSGNVDGYLEAISERVRPYGSHLEEVFRLEQEKPDPKRFDDRSIAFGIASLSYSRSVSDVSRVWLYIWQQANGDMEGVPFPLFTEDHEDES
jgi:hypothetical protein